MQGLSDEEVKLSRQRYGSNVLTPPKKKTLAELLRTPFRFWLLKVEIALLVAATVLLVALGSTDTTNNGFALDCTKLWIGPAVLTVLSLLTYLVAFLGGKSDEKSGRFRIDSLVTILLAALVLSGGIAFYQGVFVGVPGFQPYFEPLGIAFAVLMATGVSYVLELRNEKTFKSLNEVNDDTPVKVMRNGNVTQVPRRDIVVGDIVLLSTGEEIPADCELLESLNLTVNESTLTGEPLCHKSLKPSNSQSLNPSDQPTYPVNHVMKGTTIMEGYCTARVFAVGDSTACGKVFELARVKEGDPTPLSQKLDRLARIVTIASYVVAGLIVVGRILVYFLQGGVSIEGAESEVGLLKYLLDSVMIAVTLIVVSVPEGLPMAVTLSLAFSMRRLMDQKTLPRTMHSCETMGAVSVICTDKTGTLTQNQMHVSDIWNVENIKEGHLLFSEAVSCNTTANLDYTASPSHPIPVGNPTEGAMLLWLHSQGEDYRPIRESAPLLDRIPFSTENKYMATLVNSQILHCPVLYLTGAPEIVMQMCEMSDEERCNCEKKLAHYQSQAMRTLALAYARWNIKEPLQPFDSSTLQTSNPLTLLSIVAISDPVRPEVPGAIKECMDAGIEIKIVTGDTVGTAKEIGRQVGLWNDTDGDQNLLTGSEVSLMTDDELRERLPKVKIISRARPDNKERVVRMLKSMGETVAVTGDGTNDAPALNAAHVGLSMGDGTSVAKESSDMTILDNSFGTISNAVMWGRSLYKNIKRFILFQMTVNVTASFIVLVGAFIGTEPPLTVTQMLWVNLIMDTFAALALASLPPTHAVMKEKPRKVDESILKDIGKNILFVGISFALILLAILLYLRAHFNGSVLSGNGSAPDGAVSTWFFTIFVMMHFWYLFNAKAFMTKDSAFKDLSWHNTKWFNIIVIVIFVVQIALVEVPGLQEMFGVAPGGLGLANWLVIILATSFVTWIGEIYRLLKNK